MTQRLWTAEAIVHAARPRKPISQEPFLEDVRAGRASLPAIALYVESMACMADWLPRYLAQLMAASPSRRLRLHMLENLMEEEGFGAPEGRLTILEGRAHGELARKTAAALDPRPVAERPEGVSGRSLWVERAIGQGRWPAAAAYLFAAWEGVSPEMCKALLDGLRTHYQIAEKDLEYLALHEELDVEHSRVGSELLAAELATEEEWRDAIAGARYGARACHVWHAVVGRAAAKL
ncbi:MAG: iron-containing redox enzyme family protein [Acidobacteria bacterium]|nr:iron-containing redox enzyme family protein [Acidobacteriota bacterium]